MTNKNFVYSYSYRDRVYANIVEIKKINFFKPSRSNIFLDCYIHIKPRSILNKI